MRPEDPLVVVANALEKRNLKYVRADFNLATWIKKKTEYKFIVRWFEEHDTLAFVCHLELPRFGKLLHTFVEAINLDLQIGDFVFEPLISSALLSFQYGIIVTPESTLEERQVTETLDRMVQELNQYLPSILAVANGLPVKDAMELAGIHDKPPRNK